MVTEGLSAADDAAVWSHALRRGYVIVSKDADFRQRSFLLGAPPKVVWVRIGNCTARAVGVRIRARSDAIVRFIADPEAAFLEA